MRKACTRRGNTFADPDDLTQANYETHTTTASANHCSQADPHDACYDHPNRPELHATIVKQN